MIILIPQSVFFFLSLFLLTFLFVRSKCLCKQIKRWPNGLACADWGCPTARSAAGTICTGRASRPSEFACAWSASTNRRRPFCTCDSGRAALPSASACGSWRTSSARSGGRRSGSGTASRPNASGRAPSNWPPGWTICGNRRTGTAARPNASSYAFWACSVWRRSCRTRDTNWLYPDRLRRLRQFRRCCCHRCCSPTLHCRTTAPFRRRSRPTASNWAPPPMSSSWPTA